MATIKTFVCCIALAVCCSVLEAQSISIDFESAAVGDQTRTVNGLGFPRSSGGSSTTLGDSLIAPVGVGGSNGILHEGIWPGYSSSVGLVSQQCLLLNARDSKIEIGQMLSISTDMRIENATTFADDFANSRIVSLKVISSTAALGRVPVRLVLNRGRIEQGVPRDPQEYVFGVAYQSYQVESVVYGDVADLGLVNNSPNEVSDFFNVEMVIQRNAEDDFTVIGYLDDENGVNLQTVSITNLDFSDVFDVGGKSVYSYEVDNTAFAAHENLVFDNFRFSVSVPEPSPRLGDCNLNGVIDFLDITPFIAVLSAGDYLIEADINEDGGVDFLDIGPFIAVLGSQG